LHHRFLFFFAIYSAPFPILGVGFFCAIASRPRFSFITQDGQDMFFSSHLAGIFALF